MADFTTAPAAQQVLSTCELISEILQNLYEHHSTDDSTDEINKNSKYSPPSWYSMLEKYSRVNKSWFHEATRLLWPDGTAVKHHSLIQILAMIEPSRRQYYANYIQSACFVDVCKANIRKNNKILRGMVFPKLRYLAVIIKRGGRQKLWMPYLNAPRLEALHIRISTIQWNDGYSNAKVTFEGRKWRRPSLHSSIAISLIRRIQRDLKGVKFVLLGKEIVLRQTTFRTFFKLIPNVMLTYGHDFDKSMTIEEYLRAYKL